eukprot:g3191.t1
MKSHNFFLLFLIPSILFTSAIVSIDVSTIVSIDAPTVVIDAPLAGKIEGNVVKNGTQYQFLGIPYAKPPVKDLRWRAPVSIPRWNNTLKATSKRLPCPQQNTEWSEDCLYMNIYTPKAPKKLLPVMVWVHGGCFVGGNSYNPSGGYLADERDVVVVSISYRLNVFGYLGGNQRLASRDDHGSSGNYGQLDQRLALQWIQDNIEAFGGDKNNVFLWGQSSGAGSVSWHLVAKNSWPLFHKAGMESGSFANWIAISWEAATKKFNTLLQRLGCSSDDLNCALNKSADEVLKQGMVGGALDAPCRDGCSWAPVVDGVELSDYPWVMLEKGIRKPNVSILHGWNRDDGDGFVAKDVAPLSNEATESELLHWIETVFSFSNTTALEVLQLYKEIEHPSIEGFSNYWWIADRIETDFAYACPAKRASHWFSSKENNNNNNNVYLYEWAYDRSKQFVVHGQEVNYVFDERNILLSPSDQNVANVTSKFFKTFVTTGHPTNQQKEWPTYQNNNTTARLFFNGPLQNPIGVEKNFLDVKCNFWNNQTQLNQCVTPVPK